MFTDPKRIKRTDPGHPKQCNVYNYYEVFKPDMSPEVYNWCTKAQLGCTECKAKLAEVLIEKMEPMQEKRKHFLSHRDLVMDVLKEGRQEAEKFASKTVNQVKEAMGYGII